MICQRLAFIVLLCFVTAAASSSANAVLQAMVSADNITHYAPHSEGGPCPDSEDSSHPCGPACACICCPGHSASVVFFVQPVFWGAPAAKELEFHLGDVLHPRDVRFRIFHPPRA